MEWTVHPDFVKLLGWLVIIFLAFINGILFEQNRQRDRLRKNKQTRLLKEIDNYLANQLKNKIQ
ncbi:MAG: hypothetical protein CBD62_00965 [Candidatus Pelagibacter sp. TMED202]|nr:MAG: hypothetical protein CBD62_00965 [Candidatus Pelagibacter sp. TMED202]|tara:strand:- start:465 stop:656 length:192 start_codon:yes stop_codon:yes gene_type:complete